MAAIGDWCRSLSSQGFEKLYFLNGHGGNVATIEAAFSELYAEATYAGKHRGFACKLKNWWDLSGVLSLANRQFPVGHGSHATPSEIAVTQWAYPDSIKDRSYAPQIAPTGPIREAADFRARYADGRMGSDPGLATPEKGGELVALAAKSLIDDVAAFGRRIIELLTSASLRAEMAAGGCSFVETEGSWEVMGSRINDLVTGVVKGTSAGPSPSLPSLALGA